MNLHNGIKLEIEIENKTVEVEGLRSDFVVSMKGVQVGDEIIPPEEISDMKFEAMDLLQNMLSYLTGDLDNRSESSRIVALSLNHDASCRFRLLGFGAYLDSDVVQNSQKGESK